MDVTGASPSGAFFTSSASPGFVRPAARMLADLTPRAAPPQGPPALRGAPAAAWPQAPPRPAPGAPGPVREDPRDGRRREGRRTGGPRARPPTTRWRDRRRPPPRSLARPARAPAPAARP